MHYIINIPRGCAKRDSVIEAAFLMAMDGHSITINDLGMGVTKTFTPEGEFKMEEYVPDVSRRAVIFALRKYMQNMDLTNPIYTTLRDALFLLERDGKLLLEYDQKLRDFEKRFM